MSVRALRGVVQLDQDDKAHMHDSVKTLIKGMLDANSLAPADLISMVFTATPDLHSGFPAEAARNLGLLEVPLTCSQELRVDGAMPMVVRVLCHVETERARADLRHVYLGGAAALRTDITGSGR